MDRPEFVTDNFWDSDASEVKLEDVFKHVGDLSTKYSGLETKHTDLETQHTTLQTENETLKGKLPGEPPETYEFKLKDGTVIDGAAAEAFIPVLKELGVSQDGAAKLFGLYVNELDRQDGELTDVFKQQRTEWANSSKTDNEFGGDKFDDSLVIAQKAIAKFGSDDFKTLLEETGLGNHPEVIRAFWKIGTLISEDQTLLANRGAHDEKDVAALMFPKSPEARSQ